MLRERNRFAVNQHAQLVGQELGKTIDEINFEKKMRKMTAVAF